MPGTFEEQLYTELGNFDAIFDTAGAFAGSEDEFFRQLGLLARKLQTNALTVADASEFKAVFEQLARVYEKINAALRADPLPPASQAGTALKAYFNGLTLDARYQAGQLAKIADQVSQGDLSGGGRLASVASEAFKNLGAYFALIQTGSALFEGGTVSQDNVASATGKAIGFYVGLQGGAASAALAGGLVTVGIGLAGVAAAPILVGAAAIAGAVAGGYFFGKFGEVLWAQAYENYKTIYLPKLLDGASPAISTVQTKLADWAIKLGKRDGTWLESVEVSAEAKALLSGLVLSPSSVQYSDALNADIVKLFEAFDGESAGSQALVGRDLLLKTVLVFAKDNGYGSERVTPADDGASLTLTLPSFSTTAMNGLRDYLQATLSAQDQAALSLTPPGRITVALEAGEITGTQAEELIVGSAGDDTLDGGAGRDLVLGGGGGDKVRGGEGVDDLFGGEGDDTLDGGAGGDYLFGGAGNDEYRLKAGELADVISDSDGSGSLWIDDVQLTGGKKLSDTFWISDDKSWAYMLMANGDLVVLRDSSLDRVVIRGWQSQSQKLGITLDDAPAPPPPPAPPADNLIDGTDNADTLTGKGGNDVIRGFGGDDWIQAPGTGNLFIDGGAGRDLVNAGNGDDTLLGGAGRDVVLGQGGKDELWGGNKSDFATVNGQTEPVGDAEADLLAGGAGKDTLYGGAGNDAMYGGGGADLIVGGAGDDNILSDMHAEQVERDTWQLTRTYTPATEESGAKYFLAFVGTGYSVSSDPGNDTLFGGAGKDWITAGAGADVVDAGLGDDAVWGMAGDDVIDGGQDDDYLQGDGSHTSSGMLDYTPLEQHGNDTLYGGDGMDTLYGDGGNDYLDGGDDQDSVTGGGGNDDLFGGGADDKLAGDEFDLDGDQHGNDYLDGEDGNDTLRGQGRDDTLFGGIGNDLLVGDDNATLLDGSHHGDDYLDGEGGNDTLFGTGGKDTLFGGIGADALYGDDAQLDGQYHGSDYLDGEEGDDTLVGGGGADDLFGGGGADQLIGDDGELAAQYHGGDYLDGEDGSDTLLGGGGDDSLFGGIGNDTLFGDHDGLALESHGNDYLDGEDGDDSLVGQGGDDTLAGGAGTDTLFGSEGDDQLSGDGESDTLVGGAGQDALAGGDGNDALWGDDDDDWLDGGTGDDQLSGGNGHDVLAGGSGANQLFGDAGNDLLFGEGGDTLVGGDGDDTLVGQGSDVMVGGTGDDTYVVDLTAPHSIATDFVQDMQGSNHIRLVGATAASLSLTPSQVQGFMDLTTPTGSIGIRNLLTDFSTVEIGGVTLSTGDFFGQTFAWEVTDTESASGAGLQGGKLNDTLTSTGGSSTLAGGLGDDTLAGSGGGNTYVYNAGGGADTITDTSGATQRGTLVFGAGIQAADLTLSVSGGNAMVITFGDARAGSVTVNGFNPANAAATPAIATYRFSDGIELTHAQLIARGFEVRGTSAGETLSGTSQGDRLAGGAGDDTLAGGAGADIYLFAVGDGSDVIADGDTMAGTGDTLRFGDGIVSADLRALRTGNDVMLVAGSDTVTLKDYFGGSADAVEIIQFADGSAWAQADVLAAVAAGAAQGWALSGDGGNNLLRGLGGNDTLDGKGGADTLYGAGGDDLLSGGGGDDILYGQGGSDTYTVLPGSDRDTIDERDGGDAQGVDTVFFGGGLTREDVEILASGNDLYIRNTGPQPWFEAVVAGQFAGSDPAGQVERFEFSDGTVLTAQQIRTELLRSSAGADWINGFDGPDAISGGFGRDVLIGAGGADTLHGDEGADQLAGEAGSDVLHGGAGDDRLDGSADDDTLSGGAGWDRLDGGAGNDSYAFGLGDGMDIIVADSAGTDTVRLAAGLTAANVTLHRVSAPPAANLTFRGDSLVIQLNAGSDQLWISNFFDPAAPGAVETISFADGASWNYSTIVSKLATQGGTANTQTGTTKADTFAVDHWNDVVNDPSYTDADTVNASVGWRLPENVNNLTLTGALNLFGIGSSAADTLRGNTGDNTLEFTADGVVTGDTLIGGKGNDVYVVRGARLDIGPEEDPAKMGNVVITELAGEGTDTLVSGFWSSQLPANVENLVMAQPNTFNPQTDDFNYRTSGPSIYTHKLTGNALDNVIDASLYQSHVSSQPWFAYRNMPNFIGVVDFRLDGGTGADTLVGGVWHDTYVIDSAADVVIETGVSRDGYDSSSDTVETPFQTSLLTQFPNVENITLTGTQAVSATGNARGNQLGGSLNTAANVLTGGAGDDTYVVGAGDTVVELAGEGTDTLVVAAGFAALVQLASYANVENLRLRANVGDVNAEGTDADNVIDGSLGSNSLWGGGGDDTMADQFLADILYMGKGSVTEPRPANDADALYGGAGNDTLVSRGGVDTLDGGAGDDLLKTTYADRATVLRFGLGDGHDVFVRDAGTTVSVLVELKAGLGPADIQLAKSGGYLTLTLGDGSSLDLPDTEPVRIRFSDGMVLGPDQIEAMLRTGDRSTPTAEADLLFGTAGADTIASLGGNDAVYGVGGADLLDGGTGNDLLFGGTGNDTLTGGAGSDTLAGGLGADIYRFGAGFGRDVVDDAYVDGVSGAADDGAVDIVEFDASVVPADVQVLRQWSGTAASALVLVVPAAGDRITLQNAYAAGGTGAVELVRFANGTQWDLAMLKSKITGEVGDAAANTLTAPVSSSRLEGMGGDDSLSGSAGNDTLDGGEGFDTMAGGAGNDTFHVDSFADQVVEASKGGTDTVVTTLDGYTLAAEVERLELAAGPAPLGGTGNALANTLVGNAGNNRLDGGAGADAMIGGAGNDTYVVDSATDAITELAGGGTDAVEATVTYTLSPHVENLRLMGTSKINGTGNELDNLLLGNSAANSLTGGIGSDTLDGAGGVDTLVGGAGDDLYVLDATTDVVNETVAGSAGSDTVNVSLGAAGTYTLSTNVENAYVGNATAGVNLTGNASANLLTGNAGNNVLGGGAGVDTLVGGGGNDTLTGGSEADRFVFDVAPGAGNTDTITDFQTGVDTIALSASLFSALGAAGTRIGLGDRLTYNSTSGVLAYDADGTGGMAAVTVAILGASTHPASLGNDFLLI